MTDVLARRGHKLTTIKSKQSNEDVILPVRFGSTKRLSIKEQHKLNLKLKIDEGKNNNNNNDNIIT